MLRNVSCGTKSLWRHVLPLGSKKWTIKRINIEGGDLPGSHVEINRSAESGRTQEWLGDKVCVCNSVCE